MNEPTKQPNVQFIAVEAGISYPLGDFDSESDKCAIGAIEAVRFMGCGNDQLALQLLKQAVTALKNRIEDTVRNARLKEALSSPVSSKFVM